MENNSQPPAPAAPAAKVTPPGNEPPKTTQASCNQEVLPMASRTTATDGSAAQPQRGAAAVACVPLRPVQQHPQPLSSSMQQVLALAGTGTGSMFGSPAQCGATMPRSPTAVGSLTCRPVLQTNPVAFGQGPSASHPGPRVRPKKLKIKRLPSLPPPKLPIYRPPPPRNELGSSSTAGNALLQPPPDTGFCVSNMEADPPSPDQVTTTAEEGSDSQGGGSSGRDDVKMLDLNFPPVWDEEN